MDGFFGGGGRGMALGSKMTIVVEECTLTRTNANLEWRLEKERGEMFMLFQTKEMNSIG